MSTYDASCGTYHCTYCGEDSYAQYCIPCRWKEHDALYILGDFKEHWKPTDCAHGCARPCSPDCEFVQLHKKYAYLFRGRSWGPK